MTEPDAIAALLARRAGLDVESLGRRSVDAAVKARAQSGRTDDVEAYLARLHSDDQEAHALLEDVVVPETWFFRDSAPFGHLGRWAADRRESLTRPIQVLSVPSSTGEEPYSIAMALCEAGLLPEQFRVDAIDVSERLLVKARAGVYERGSFRGDDIGYRDRHFAAVERGDGAEQWRIAARIRSSVSFSQGNILDRGLLAGRGPYDAVFFRNLLIYLTPEARLVALGTLTARLVEDGVLYAGHAEAIDMIDPTFRPLPHSGAFAFGRGGRGKPAAVAAPPPPPRPATPAPVRPTPRGMAPLPPPSRAATGDPAPMATGTNSDVALASARALADRGRLDAAIAAAEAFLTDNPLSADGFALLGTIRGAAGDPVGAEACFERAVYLEPNHYQALVNLAMAADRRGDGAAAARLRRRAERAATQPGGKTR